MGLEHEMARPARPARPVSSEARLPRVLLLMPEIGLAAGGGIGTVGHSLMRLLAGKHRQRAIDYRVMSLGEPHGRTESRRLQADHGDHVRWYGPRRAALSFRGLWRMARWADLAIFTHLGLASLLALLPRRMRPGSMTMLHGIEIWASLRRRQKLGVLLSDMLVADSNFTIQKARQIHPWLPPARVCHLGVPDDPPGDDGDDEREPPLLSGPHDIVIVARMAKGECAKGHRELIEAMPRVVSAVADARLLVVGTGNDAQTYRELARRSPAADRILFTGFLCDAALRAIYRRCGVLAMPSRQEGFGLVYAEAMREGVPCVASDCDAGRGPLRPGVGPHTPACRLRSAPPPGGPGPKAIPGAFYGGTVPPAVLGTGERDARRPAFAPGSPIDHVRHCRNPCRAR